MKATKFWSSLFEDYLREKNIAIDLKTCTADELAAVLKKLYVEVRKKDGSFYQRTSVRGLRAGIHRYIREPPFSRTDLSLFRDNSAFDEANDVLDAHLRVLKKQGLPVPKTKLVLRHHSTSKRAWKTKTNRLLLPNQLLQCPSEATLPFKDVPSTFPTSDFLELLHSFQRLTSHAYVYNQSSLIPIQISPCLPALQFVCNNFPASRSFIAFLCVKSTKQLLLYLQLLQEQV